MAVTRMVGKVNRPLALLGAALVWAGMQLSKRSVTIRPVAMKDETRSNWRIEWRRRRVKASL